MAPNYYISFPFIMSFAKQLLSGDRARPGVLSADPDQPQAIPARSPVFGHASGAGGARQPAALDLHKQARAARRRQPVMQPESPAVRSSGAAHGQEQARGSSVVVDTARPGTVGQVALPLSDDDGDSGDSGGDGAATTAAARDGWLQVADGSGGRAGLPGGGAAPVSAARIDGSEGPQYRPLDTAGPGTDDDSDAPQIKGGRTGQSTRKPQRASSAKVPAGASSQAGKSGIPRPRSAARASTAATTGGVSAAASQTVAAAAPAPAPMPVPSGTATSAGVRGTATRPATPPHPPRPNLRARSRSRSRSPGAGAAASTAQPPPSPARVAGGIGTAPPRPRLRTRLSDSGGSVGRGSAAGEAPGVGSVGATAVGAPESAPSQAGALVPPKAPSPRSSADSSRPRAGSGRLRDRPPPSSAPAAQARGGKRRGHVKPPARVTHSASVPSVPPPSPSRRRHGAARRADTATVVAFGSGAPDRVRRPASKSPARPTAAAARAAALAKGRRASTGSASSAQGASDAAVEVDSSDAAADARAQASAKGAGGATATKPTRRRSGGRQRGRPGWQAPALKQTRASRLRKQYARRKLVEMQRADAAQAAAVAAAGGVATADVGAGAVTPDAGDAPLAGGGASAGSATAASATGASGTDAAAGLAPEDATAPDLTRQTSGGSATSADAAPAAAAPSVRAKKGIGSRPRLHLRRSSTVTGAIDSDGTPILTPPNPPTPRGGGGRSGPSTGGVGSGGTSAVGSASSGVGASVSTPAEFSVERARKIFYGANPRSLAANLRPLDAMRLHLVFRCAAHFAQVGKWIFKHIGTLSADSQVAFTLLEIHWSNMWACLRRGDELISLIGVRMPVKGKIQWAVGGGSNGGGGSGGRGKRRRRTEHNVSDFTPSRGEQGGSHGRGRGGHGNGDHQDGGSGRDGPLLAAPNPTVVAGARIATDHLVALAVWLAQAMLVAGRMEDGIRAAEYVRHALVRAITLPPVAVPRLTLRL